MSRTNYLRGTYLWAFCAILLVQANFAAASVLYTQAYDPNGTVFASQNDTNALGNIATVYDDFTLSSTNAIDTISWTGGYFNPGSQGAISGFTLQIYADAAGQPGASLASYAIPGTANETFLTNAFFGPVYTYSTSITPFIASGGTQYWLSIVPDLGFPPQWGWASGLPGNNVWLSRLLWRSS